MYVNQNQVIMYVVDVRFNFGICKPQDRSIFLSLKMREKREDQTSLRIKGLHLKLLFEITFD